MKPKLGIYQAGTLADAPTPLIVAIQGYTDHPRMSPNAGGSARETVWRAMVTNFVARP